MMKTVLSADQQCSFAFLTYLLSLYQGRFLFFKVLVDLGVSGVDVREIPRSEEAIDRINRWFTDLTQGSPLLAKTWTTPGTFDAKKALDLIEAVKPELRWLSDVCSRATNQNVFDTLPLDELRILAACNVRLKVMAHSYCLTNIRFGDAMQLTEFAEYQRTLEPLMRAEVDAAESILQAFQSSETTRGQSFMDGFQQACKQNAAAALTHIHDINLLTAPFRGGLSFLTVDFSEQETSKWVSAGFNPTDAGYWRAYAFEPSEAAIWRKGAVQLPTIALTWKALNFSAAEAANWIRLGFDTVESEQWRAAGIPPHEARSLKERGITDPSKVPYRKN